MTLAIARRSASASLPYSPCAHVNPGGAVPCRPCQVTTMRKLGGLVPAIGSMQPRPPIIAPIFALLRCSVLPLSALLHSHISRASPIAAPEQSAGCESPVPTHAGLRPVVSYVAAAALLALMR